MSPPNSTTKYIHLPNEIWLLIISYSSVPELKHLRLLDSNLNSLAARLTLKTFKIAINRTQYFEDIIPIHDAQRLTGVVKSLTLNIDQHYKALSRPFAWDRVYRKSPGTPQRPKNVIEKRQMYEGFFSKLENLQLNLQRTLSGDADYMRHCGRSCRIPRNTFLRSMSNLRTLLLHAPLGFAGKGLDNIDPAYCWPMLEDLHLEGVALYDTDMMDLIAALTHLRRLRLSRVKLLGYDSQRSWRTIFSVIAQSTRVERFELVAPRGGAEIDGRRWNTTPWEGWVIPTAEDVFDGMMKNAEAGLEGYSWELKRDHASVAS